MFEKFNEDARRSLFFARYEASRTSSRSISTEHLLLGLLRQADDVLCEVLAALDIDVRELRKELENTHVPLEPVSTCPDPPLAENAKKALAYAAHQADGMDHETVGSEHLLLGITMVDGSSAARFLASKGVDQFKLREVISWIAEEAEAAASARQMPHLQEYARDFTELAANNLFDPLIGREQEVERVIQILCRRTKNNPLLLGEAGVGKTAIVEGLATRIAMGEVPAALTDRRILSLDLSLLVAGTKYRGQFEERLKGLLQEIRDSSEVILFVDEIHSLIGAGSAEGSLDAANILKPALSRGEISCIGATTMREYRRYVEKDRTLSRRFQPITVSQPDEQATITILRGVRSRYEDFHGVLYTDEALSLAVAHAGRYIPDRFFPDKAIDIIDEAGARVKLRHSSSTHSLRRVQSDIRGTVSAMKRAISHKDFEAAVQLREEELRQRELLEKLTKGKSRRTTESVVVEGSDVEAVVAAWTGIPVASVKESEVDRLKRIEEIINQRIVGQEAAVYAVARAIRRSRLGVASPNRPIGSFIFLGPSGVGKTEVARQLAEFLFHDPRRLIRYDMSEYMEKHTVSRLVGSPPGYVGFEEGGQLSEHVRRQPYSVILLDEIEKAHSDIANLLLQVLEDGRLTDNSGNVVDFTNTLIIMTSNLGSRSLGNQSRMGFGDARGRLHTAEVREIVDRKLRRHFSPEFLNRLDDVIVFAPLSEQTMVRIAEILLQETSELLARQGVGLAYDDDIPQWLCSQCHDDPLAGARPLRRLIRQWIEDPVADFLINHRSGGDVSLSVEMADGIPLVKARESTVHVQES